MKTVISMDKIAKKVCVCVMASSRQLHDLSNVCVIQSSGFNTIALEKLWLHALTNTKINVAITFC